jgi:hypothetical protein
VCDKYGIVNIPACIIPNLPFMDRAALESYGGKWGISYTPFLPGELKKHRFLTLFRLRFCLVESKEHIIGLRSNKPKDWRTTKE